MMLKTFYIFFSDLNEDAQKRILEFVGENDPKEMNWDMDILPIATYEIEDTAEYVKVIRCKNCIHRKTDDGGDWCEVNGSDVDLLGFCADGERKETEDE